MLTQKLYDILLNSACSALFVILCLYYVAAVLDVAAAVVVEIKTKKKINNEQS